MLRYNLLSLIFIVSCATAEKGKIGYVLMEDPIADGQKEVKLYKDYRYTVWGEGCVSADHFAPIVDKMIEYYNEANPNGEVAYGMADITYTYDVDFIFPCLYLTGIPLIKTKYRSNGLIPIELNYLK